MTAADDRLTNNFNNCPDLHLEQHLPFAYDDTNAVADIRNLKTVCQDGYVIRYSTERRTPLYTAERLDGAVMRTPVRIFHYSY